MAHAVTEVASAQPATVFMFSSVESRGRLTLLLEPENYEGCMRVREAMWDEIPLPIFAMAGDATSLALRGASADGRASQHIFSAIDGDAPDALARVAPGAIQVLSRPVERASADRKWTPDPNRALADGLAGHSVEHIYDSRSSTRKSGILSKSHKFLLSRVALLASVMLAIFKSIVPTISIIRRRR